MSVSNGNDLLTIGAKISDASIGKYSIVTGDTTNTTNSDRVMKAATGGTTKPLGVVQEATAAANKIAAVRVAGISKVRVNGSGTEIDIGDSIIASAGGEGVKVGAASATEQWAIGFALEPSAADNDEIDVLISPHLIVKGTA
jgi:hypothetical protein